MRQHRRPVTAAALAAELGVSVRSVYRDIATLTAEGAPIRGEAGLGYVMERGYFLPPLMFELEELDAVLLGLRLVENRGDQALAEAARAATAKIEAVLPDHLDNLAEGSGLLAFSRGSSHAEMLKTVRQAIRAERKLDIDYSDAAGAPSRRRVWPVAIGFLDEVELLAAWCELRGAFRHFRLDRIKAVERCEERMPRPHRSLIVEWRKMMESEKAERGAAATC